MAMKILLTICISIFCIIVYLVFLKKKELKKSSSIEELKQEIKGKRKKNIFICILSGIYISCLLSLTSTNDVIQIITIVLMGLLMMSFDIMYTFMLISCIKDKEKEQKKLKQNT